ncbi:hypothetical protein B0H34DRAFT_689390 [Crassisporium funariophilum]|nr:hypothetical protein B0H34DRAFT_689390 [Crassisporium funariophilum]
MPRPQPLQELPLERFLPSNPNLPHSTASLKPTKTNKRPLSPGGPILYSPTKRRILNDEGIFSPDKMWKTPISSSKEKYASPARFGDILAGSASPARILDFGLPKNCVGEPQKRSLADSMEMDVTPTKRPSSSTRRLAPSPKLKPKTVRPTTQSSDYQVQAEHNRRSAAPSPTPPRPQLVPTIVVRELPTAADPQSIHFPGFVVFQDTHITIYPPGYSGESESDTEVGKDVHKENLPPRCKAQKAATTPGSLGSKRYLDSDLVGDTPRKTKSVSGAPHSPMFGGRTDLFTPRNHGAGGLLWPSSARRDNGNDLRRMMEDEFDYDEDRNDD